MDKPPSSRSAAAWARSICRNVACVSPVARKNRRWIERSERFRASPLRISSITGSRVRSPLRTRFSTKTSALLYVGISMTAELSANEPLPSSGSVIERSARRSLGRHGIKVPGLNWMPKNSMSGGIGTDVATVSGPRTVTKDRPSFCLATTISEWLAATEMNAGADTLTVRQIFATKGELSSDSSNTKSLDALCRPQSVLPVGGESAKVAWSKRVVRLTGASISDLTDDFERILQRRDAAHRVPVLSGGGRSRSAEPLAPALFHIFLALYGRERHGYDIMQQVGEDSRGAVRRGPIGPFGDSGRGLCRHNRAYASGD